MDVASVPDRKRILLVDDIELNRVLTAAVLAAGAYEVDCVGDGAAAVQAVGDKAYDLVLMDLDMPGLDGFAAASAIVEKTEATAPKVVALSSRNSAAERTRARQCGMSSHLARPLAPNDLLSAVGQLLEASTIAAAPLFRPDIQHEIRSRLGNQRTRGFLARLLVQCEAARDAAHGDQDGYDRLAHDLASTSGMLGYERLSLCCRDVLVADTGAARLDALPHLSFALTRTIALLRRHVDEVEAAA